MSRVCLIPRGIRRDGTRERRRHNTRRERIDPHAECADLSREPARHLHDARFGRRVDALSRLDIHRAHRRHQDDAPASILQHRPGGGAAHAKRALQIQLDHAIKFFIAVIEQSLAQIDCRRGQQHIEPSVLAHDLVHHVFDGGGVANIDVHRARVAAVIANALADTFRVIMNDVRNDHVRTECSQAFGAGLPDARSSADDERNSSRQIVQRPVIERLGGIHRVTAYGSVPAFADVLMLRS